MFFRASLGRQKKKKRKFLPTISVKIIWLNIYFIYPKVLNRVNVVPGKGASNKGYRFTWPLRVHPSPVKPVSNSLCWAHVIYGPGTIPLRKSSSTLSGSTGRNLNPGHLRSAQQGVKGSILRIGPWKACVVYVSVVIPYPRKKGVFVWFDSFNDRRLVKYQISKIRC